MAATLLIVGVSLLQTNDLYCVLVGALLALCGVGLGILTLLESQAPVAYQDCRGFHYGIPVRGHSDDNTYRVVAADGQVIAIFEGNPTGLQEAREFCQKRDDKLQVLMFSESQDAPQK